MAVLAPPDQKILSAVLNWAWEMERLWSKEQLQNQEQRSQSFSELKELILLCREAQSPLLNRLALSAEKFHEQMSLKEFQIWLVPFERLSHRGLKDADFLIQEGDHKVVREPGQRPLVFMLDYIRSAFNVGSMFRTAECLGAREVILSGYTPTPLDDKVKKTAMGTHELVPWKYFEKSMDAISYLKAEGFAVVALETSNQAQNVLSFDWPLKSAVVLGNERFGLDAGLLEICDAVVRIPVEGQKNSLNVSIAMGVAGYSYLKIHTSQPLPQ